MVWRRTGAVVADLDIPGYAAFVKHDRGGEGRDQTRPEGQGDATNRKSKTIHVRKDGVDEEDVKEMRERSVQIQACKFQETLRVTFRSRTGPGVTRAGNQRVADD